MQIIQTKFPGLIIYKRKTHKDNRGFFRELFSNAVLKKKFVFDYYSLSKKNVISVFDLGDDGETFLYIHQQDVANMVS